ncbi:MAG: exopolyphosphatase [Schleiferiaceae bacterium]|nr:exopolyphosphatase [Schleiferiaceae bacterium]
MNIIKLAAIDIGSNSLRLLVSNVIPTPDYTHYKKASMTRLPVRLGEDVFKTGRISKETGDRLVESMRAFSAIMKVNGVESYRACATSAMREAKNKGRWIRKIRRVTGIQIEVIEGDEEAHLIYNAKLFDKIHPVESSLLFIDVGGGSTELTFFSDGQAGESRSFPIGTVRSLNAMDSEREWQTMQAWVEGQVRSLAASVALVGSGGNINKAHKLSGRPLSEPLSRQYLDRLSNQISALSTEERVMQMGLNLDRADVIVPALQIYRRTMKWAGATRIYVPKIGVSDGMIRELYHRDFKKLLE